MASIPEPDTVGYGFDNGPVARIVSLMAIFKAKARRRRCSISEVMLWTGRLRHSALLRMVIRFVLVSASFFWHLFYDVDFLFRVTDTWSHRYSELLCYTATVLQLAGSNAIVFIQ